jgi:hypothetical protein
MKEFGESKPLLAFPVLTIPGQEWINVTLGFSLVNLSKVTVFITAHCICVLAALKLPGFFSSRSSSLITFLSGDL